MLWLSPFNKKMISFFFFSTEPMNERNKKNVHEKEFGSHHIIMSKILEKVIKIHAILYQRNNMISTLVAVSNNSKLY